ncbi:YgaP family membrane protein [Verrucomicrobiota bacterium sgz303538]
MNFWSRNIDTRGRSIRIGSSLFLFIATLISALNGWNWLAVILGISAAFVLYEGLRGWCLLRACGVKTRF